MCKLYGYHGWLTRDEARKKIAEKAKKILRTESHGMGYALNVDGVTTIFKCGESFTDAVGGDVTALLQNDFSKLVSLSIHGRTSTSQDRSANHAHPRETKYGPLMHNGVVIPKSKDGWSKEHDLDTDYLAELASTDRLHLADKYLLGYAGVILIMDDGTMIVQNQGANLYIRVEKDEIEVGTTMDLCPSGMKFENMSATIANSCITMQPMPVMTGRAVAYNPQTNLTEVGQKKLLTLLKPIASGKTGTNSNQGSGSRSKSQIGPNPKKKGRFRHKRGSTFDFDWPTSKEGAELREAMGMANSKNDSEWEHAYADFRAMNS